MKPSSSKMRLFLHIGPAKTASTFIQQVCSLNSERLLEQGVFYPTENCQKMYTGGFNCNDTAIKLIDGQVDQSIDAITSFAEKARSAGCGSLLISAEGFSPALLSSRRDSSKFIKQLSKDFDVEVLFFYRNFLDTVNSHFSQVIKSVSKWRLYNEVYKISRNLYFKRKDGILKIANKNKDIKISILLFYKEMSPFEHICRALGVDSSGFEYPDRKSNARPHAATIALGYLAGQQAIPFRPHQMNALEEYLRARRFLDPKLTIVPAKDVPRIIEEQRDDLERLSGSPNIEIIGSLPDWWEETLVAHKNCVPFENYLSRISRIGGAPAPFNSVTGPAAETATA